MGAFKEIVDFFIRAINFTVSPITWLVAWIASSTAAFFASIISVVRSVVHLFPQFYDYLERVDSALSAFQAYMAENMYWHFFYNLFSLDVLAQVITYFLTMAGTILFLSGIGVVFASLSAVIPFLIYKSVRSAVTVLSAGLVKIN